MKVITTHVNADFDCLAAMAAAHKLHPDALMAFSGSQEKNVRDFMAAAGSLFPVVKLKNLDLGKVTSLIMVDTSSKERLGPFKDLIGKVPVTVYDHHPFAARDFAPDEAHIAPRGACTTLMVELLREKGIPVSREEATLLMLGIYEDTGALTFTSTRREDFLAAAWLLEQGADLNIVSDYLHRNLSREQTEMLHELMDRMEYHDINGVEVAMAFVSSKRYIGDLAMVVHTLKEMENIYALFVAVEMEGRINMIARSRIPAVDAGAVAGVFGGGGHPTAASAVVRDMLMPDVREKLLDTLRHAIPPSPVAGDMMVTPVISITRDETIAQAEAMLTRYGFNALPVAQDGAPVGIITRQTVEKALYHSMGGEKVADYMNTAIASVRAETPYATVKEIVIHQKQKVVPVLDNKGMMTGIIGRTDVMHAVYADMMKSHAALPRSGRKVVRPVARDMTAVMKERLPEEIKTLLERVADCAAECGYTAYAVGGFVRDLIMRRNNYDVDVVIEGDGIDFAHRFAGKHGGKVRPHKTFHTAIVTLGAHRKMDVATARTEYYTEPAALPIVEMSSIKNDLFRRDFTINALAVKLNGKNKNHLIDFFGGQQDLKDEVIRVLHSLSFVEDPTRIFRAIRFEQRFHMSVGAQTEKLMKLAIANRLVERISGSRLFGELRQIFNEENPSRALWRMENHGLWGFIHPEIKYNDAAHVLCRQAEEAVAWHRLTGDGKRLRPWMVYLLCLAQPLDAQAAREMMERLGFMKGPVTRFLHTRQEMAHILARIEKKPPKTPVEVFETFDGMDDEGLTALMAATRELDMKKVIADYMTRIRHIRPKLSGADLLKEGIQSGPEVGKILDALRRENINGLLATKEEELRFAKAYHKKLVGKGI